MPLDAVPYRIALLPGSRNSERQYLMPVLCDLARSMPAVQWVWVEARPGFLASYYADMPGQRVTGLDRLPEVHAAVTASGTVTLELGLMGIPMVIIYKVSALSAWIAKKLIRIPHLGLPNILLGAEVCPELLQTALTTASLRAAVDKLLVQAQREQQYQALGTLRGALLGADAQSLLNILDNALMQFYSHPSDPKHTT